MAAYAALVSVMYIIEQIQEHPRPPIALDQEQVRSLTENLTFLQGFLERYSSSGSKEDGDLESRIAIAAYAAEDVIESHIVGPSTIHREKVSCLDFCQGLRRVMQYIVDQIRGGSVDLYQGLERVIGDMDLIREEVMIIIERNSYAADLEQIQGQPHTNSSASTTSVRPPSTVQNSTAMVGFDDVLFEALDKLTSQQSNLLIIPIVGMGGIGKTTLARNVYGNPFVVEYFDIVSWITISQEYNRREILLQVLYQENRGSRMSENELGEKVYKKLFGRRYLIVMDDIWSTEAWDNLKFFIPDNDNGSRIMMTTRLSNLAFQLSGSHGIQMKFLDSSKSWNLLCQTVFGIRDCPIELVEIGQKIAKNCRGLPLSIVVIGGLLKRSNFKPVVWEYTLKNLNSLLTLENNQHCFQILNTSYQELPIHLKPCFLYMGVFPEDSKICVSELIKVWVGEGFMKPVAGKNSEEVAEECVQELIDRNLISIHELRWNGKAKLCNIHDLLRDLCIKVAQEQRFLCLLRQQDVNFPQGINMERRICIHENAPARYSPQFLHALESASLARSLLLIRGFHEPSASFCSSLMRVYSWVNKYYSSVIDLTHVEAIFQQANLRYLSMEFNLHPSARFPSSWSLLWNLQTLKVVVPFHGKPIVAPSAIWKMPLLRHVIFNGLELPNPPPVGDDDDIVLENLQTLSSIWNFKCSEEVVRRIPSIKKLKISYDRVTLEEEGLSNFFHKKLCHLQMLESLSLYLSSDAISDPEIFQSDFVQNLTFPHSLKKLTLHGTMLYWEDLTTMIGSLPLLQVLKLESGSCRGPDWETNEQQFCSLKFLLIDGWSANLRCWTTDSYNFPRLEHLVLQNLVFLKEIPPSVGEIPTLQLIQLVSCSKSVIDSAIKIQAVQEELGNDIKLQIDTRRRKSVYLG